MKSQIANILREAADKIEAVCFLDSIGEEHARGMTAVPLVTPPAPLPELPTEPALPEPPEGFHKAIRGPLKVIAKEEQAKDICILARDGTWINEAWGKSPGEYFALRIGSEISKLNGLEDEPNPDTARREWELNVQAASLTIRARGPMIASNESVTVREVRPGDPTPEQVEELVRSAEHLMEKADDSDDARYGTLATGFVREILLPALAPFRKP